jgi:hypothetical protein
MSRSKRKSKSRSKAQSKAKSGSKSKSSSTLMSEPTLTPRLPQELWDCVIDHLHLDQAALRTCSLVCKDWLPTSRLHTHIRPSPSNCADLLSLLEDPLCTLKPFVKLLEIEYRPSHPSESCPEWVDCLRNLHSVDRLELYLGAGRTCPSFCPI